MNKPLPDCIDEEVTFTFTGTEYLKVVLTPFKHNTIICKVFKDTGTEWKLIELSSTYFLKDNYWHRVRQYVMSKIYLYC